MDNQLTTFPLIDAILAESDADRAAVRSFLYPLITGGFQVRLVPPDRRGRLLISPQWPSWHASPSPFYLPEPPCEHAARLTSPAPPHTRLASYLSHGLALSAPPLLPAATQAYLARFEVYEARQACANRRRLEALVPRTRAERDASHVLQPSLEDVDALAAVHMGYPARANDDEAADGEDEPVRGSAQHDADWFRLVSCMDPRADEMSPLRGPVFKLGQMGGCWAGRQLVSPPSCGLRLDRSLPLLFSLRIFLSLVVNPSRSLVSVGSFFAWYTQCHAPGAL
jgi:hypothetical protein